MVAVDGADGSVCFKSELMQLSTGGDSLQQFESFVLIVC